MIVHVSNGEAMEEIRRAQQRGLKIYGETCPQYLVLTEKDLEGLNMEGAKYVCSPPPRDEASQKACWEGLQQGVFSLFSSDHCPFRYDDPQGKLTPKGRTSFRWVPNGIPGVETRLPILFSEGVARAASRSTSSSRSPRPTTPRPTGSIRRRAPSRSAPMPTSRSGIRSAR